MKITRRKMLTASTVAGLSAAGLAGGVQAAEKKSGSSSGNSKPIRIAVMNFMHENVTFLPYDTVLDDFIYEGSPARGEALLGSGFGTITGFVKVAREHANVEVVGIESPLFPKRGSASGWVTKDAFDTLMANMIKDLKAQGPFDGAYLSLHGAMSVRDVPRAEAEIARRVREVIGPKAFIAGTFDPHGNEDQEFLRYANFAFCIKYYPHYDDHLQGERAARMLIRSIRGDYKPTTATRKPPIITASVLQWTGASPWMDIVQRALVWEARSPDVYVSFYYGFAFGDAVDCGMTFQVMTNGDPELANKVAEDMATTAWRLRKELVYGTKVYSHAEGVKLAKEALASNKNLPVVLADHSDRSGAATWQLEQVINQKLSKTLLGTVADEQAIEALRKKGVKVGDKFDMEIGGRLDESAGKPVRVTGVVHTVSGGIGRFGGATKSQLWVSVKFGDGNVVIISPYLYQNLEPDEFMDLGINPADFKVFCIKSRVHFRRGYHDNGYAKTILLVEPEQPFVGTVRLEALNYKHVKLDKFYPYGKNVTYP